MNCCACNGLMVPVVGEPGKFYCAFCAVQDKVDMVNHPPHYEQGGIECIVAIQAALTPEEFRGFCKGNALKYVWREKHKGRGEDLKKAAWYLGKLTQMPQQGEKS